MTADETWQTFDGDFHSDIRESLLRGAMATYPAAWEAVSSFTGRTAAWLQPLHRHALTRDTVLSFAKRFPGVTTTVEKTTPPTTDYVTVRAGQSVVTIASVHETRELPRWARHRATLAAGMNADLFDEPDDGRVLYGILLCGPSVHYKDVRHVPAFVDIGIPARDYDCYLHYVSLYDEFPDVVEEVTGVKPAAVRDAYLEMRRQQVLGGGEAS